MQTTVSALPARRTITLARLLDAPLDDLLLELDVELHLSSITDAGFYGAVVQRRDGQLILAMPRGRSSFERDTVARMLLSEVLSIDTAPVPSPLKLEAAI